MPEAQSPSSQSEPTFIQATMFGYCQHRWPGEIRVTEERYYALHAGGECPECGSSAEYVSLLWEEE